MAPPKAQLELAIKNRLKERMQRMLEKRQAQLRYTLDEIAFIESQNADGAYNSALPLLRTKRDRQQRAVESSIAYLKALAS